MDTLTTAEHTTTSEVPNTTFAEKLKEEDRQNLSVILTLISERMKELGQTGMVVAVGSSVEQKKPYDQIGDIDLVVIQQESTNKKFETDLENAEYQFSLLRDVAEHIVKQDSSLGIPDIRPDKARKYGGAIVHGISPPFPDHEFPSVVGGNGSIMIRPKGFIGKAFELLPRHFTGNIDDFRKRENLSLERRPYSVVKHIT